MYKISNNSEVVIFLLGEMRWNDSAGIPGPAERIDILYKKMVNFKPLFQSYELEILPSQLIRLDPLVSGLLLKIIEKVEYLFTLPSKRHISVDIDQDYLNYFPAFEQQFR